MIRLRILNPSIISLIYGLINYIKRLDLNISDDNNIEDYNDINMIFWINKGIDFIITSIIL
jgi:hypothetical protein